MSHWILSNSIEILFEHLKADLFGEEENPFQERFLVVPHASMHTWLWQQLASSLDIAFGVEILSLQQAFARLYGRFFESHLGTSQPLPSPLELFLSIEGELEKGMQSQDSLWQPVQRYLAGKERRRITLVKQLTQLFMRYGIYAGTKSLAWEKNPTEWQEAIWSAVFRNWSYPTRLVKELSKKSLSERKVKVYLFGFSSLSPLHYEFFQKLSEMTPVFIYLFSPCQEFWSESHLEKEQNSLLVHLGRLGREMARFLEEGGISTEERYLLFGGEYALKKLQRGILLGQEVEKPLSIEKQDDSLQLHSSPTRYREVEILQQLLLGFVFEQAIEPKDILVFAPQITPYLPYIEAFFTDILPYHIDLPNSQEEGFFLLLGLEEQRWSVPALLTLFSHPFFAQKQGFSEEDISHIRRWIRETGIRWGLDGAHREALLKKSGCSLEENAGSTLGSATWLAGLSELVGEWALAPQEARIEFTQVELLGTLISLLKQLQSDLAPLETQKTLVAWQSYLQSLLERYFVNTEEMQPIRRGLEKLLEAAPEQKETRERLYSQELVTHLLRMVCTGEDALTFQGGRDLQKICFTSLVPMQVVPARVICLLGMNHDAYPRRDPLQALDLLQASSNVRAVFNRSDEERYLFLELLLSARDKFLVSYLGSDPLEKIELPPSSVVLELLPYLPPHLCFSHLLRGYDPRYFDDTHPFPSRSPTCLALAIKYSSQKKNTSSFFMRAKKHFTLPSGHFTVDLAALIRLARSSLCHYLYFQELKIKESDSLTAEEPLLLSPLFKAQLRRERLLKGKKEAQRLIEKRGMLPLGMLGRVAWQQIEQGLCQPLSISLETLELSPLLVKLTDSLSVTCSAHLEHVWQQGLCLAAKAEFKAALLAWPQLLLLTSHEEHSAKNSLYFLESGLSKTFPLEELRAHLHTYLEYFFYAQATPCPLVAEWIEPILNKDAKKLENIPIYDPILVRLLRGREWEAEALIEEWHPWVDKVYGSLSAVFGRSSSE